MPTLTLSLLHYFLIAVYPHIASIQLLLNLEMLGIERKITICKIDVSRPAVCASITAVPREHVEQARGRQGASEGASARRC